MKLASITSVEFKNSSAHFSLHSNANINVHMIAPGASCCTLGSSSCSCGAVKNS